jgi:[CysO sulfur-carrier protein]-S-L-cysteine hydrolase
MRIARALLEDVIAHARAEAPNECCGIIGARDGRAVSVRRARNKHASPLRYEIHDDDAARIFFDLDDDGEEVGAIYHSHTRSEPVPSQTDVNLANPLLGPVLYLIVGIAGEEPDVRAWRIADGDYTPTDLVVDG